MLKHDLLHDFPEHEAKIHSLRATHHEFQKISDTYLEVDREIEKIEKELDHSKGLVEDQHLNELRMRRVHLKDQIAAFLK